VKKIAVVVEGPSDKVFWEKVLNREFAPQILFKVMSKNGRSKVVESAPFFLDACRRGGYAGIFFLVDLDDTPCVAAVRELFDGRLLVKAPEDSAFFIHICVAKKEFEAWLLADEEAIREVLPNAGYVGHEFTDELGAERKLKELLHLDRGAGAGFRKPGFAREVAPYFIAARAMARSHSFTYFWNKVTAAVAGLAP
jgi:hypothetical protein